MSSVTLNSLKMIYFCYRSKAKTMKYLLSTIILIAFNFPVIAQESNPLPNEAYQLYPTLHDMYGYAIGDVNNTILVFGGRIKSDVPEVYSEDFPNTEIILIDLERDRATAFSSGALAGIVAEQMAATGLAYFQKDSILYLIGGYGYSESQDRFITFPHLTAINMIPMIAALEKGESPDPHFYQICDERIAIFDGLLDHNGDEYFLMNGKFAYKLDPFSEEPTYHEEDRIKEVRTFQLDGTAAQPKITNLQTWYDLQGFSDYYGPLLPEKINNELYKLIERRISQ